MEERRDTNQKPVCWISSITIVSLSILTLVILLSGDTNGELSVEDKCLIVVSGYGGYSSSELGKARSFFDYISETLPDENIRYLTIQSDLESDGQATISNVQSAYEWLITESSPQDDVIIYIYDHEKRVLNETYFIFDDGNISSGTIDHWMDQISCSSITVVLNGERSGLGGPDLQGPERDIICSMRSYQTYDPDLFNITRSLEDPLADSNNDGVVDLIEAFWMEDFLLTGTGQDPVLYK